MALKCIKHVRNVPREVQMSIFLILYPTGLLYKKCKKKILISNHTDVIFDELVA